MQFQFHKYQGTGNDFILLDNRNGIYDGITNTQVRQLCDRHFGIGADGLMMLGNLDGFDFDMTYYNSDGTISSMCGNGGRCITAFAKDLGIIQSSAHFHAIDGDHRAEINTDSMVNLQMGDVHGIARNETYMELNTGSPHYIHFTEYVSEMDMKKEGRLIRNSPKFKEEGINVNFVEILGSNEIFVRTYERGVEDETWSCGTGVTASAIAFKVDETGEQRIRVKTIGGDLEVQFNNKNKTDFHHIILCGKAEFVFKGEIVL